MKLLAWLDAKDREVIGTGVVIGVAVLLSGAVIGASFGLAVRIFELVSG